MQECVARTVLLFCAAALLLGRASSGGDPGSEYCTRDDGCPESPRGGEELATAGDASAQKWNLFSAISDTITSVKDTLKYTAYKTAEGVYKTAEGVYNTTTKFAENVYVAVEDFTERVRRVFREEFSTFLEVLWESSVGTNPADDSLFQKFKRVVVNRILIAILIILCLILTYVIWSLSNNILTALLVIVGFNSAVALGYKFLGPMWVLWAFWKMVEYAWYTLSFVWTYPYTSAGIICGFFLFGMLYSVYRWRRGVERRELRDDMIRSIHMRLQKVEEQQNRIVEQNEELKTQMEKLLRLSCSENST